MAGRQVELLLSGFHDNNGQPLAAGKVYCYDSGTLAAKDLYTDRALTTPAANPIILDAYGRAVVYGDGSYKLVVTTSGGTTLKTYLDLTFGSESDFTIWGGTAGGTADALTLSPSPALTSYPDGLHVIFRGKASNTMGPTIDISGLSAKAILRKTTSGNLSPGDIVAGGIYDIVFSSASDVFVLMNPHVAVRDNANSRIVNNGGLLFDDSAGATHAALTMNTSDEVTLIAKAATAAYVRQGATNKWKFDATNFDLEPVDEAREIGDATKRLYCLYTKRINSGADHCIYTVGAAKIHQFVVDAAAQFEISNGYLNVAGATITESGGGGWTVADAFDITTNYKFLQLKIAGVTHYVPIFEAAP